MSTRDVIVIGGGVIGCSIALRLSQAGLKVTVVERNTTGREASWAAAGMLSAQTHAAKGDVLFELGIRSRGMYRKFADEIRSLSGIDPEYQDRGTLCVALNDAELKALNEWAAWQQESGLQIERLSAERTIELDPSLCETVVGSVFLAADHQVENRRLMESLAGAVRRLGVEILENTEVNSISIQGGKCSGVTLGSGAIPAGAVVIAAGSWSGGLAQDVLRNVSVVPAKGQMLSLKGSRLQIDHVIYGERCYLVPRKDGRVIVGSTIEYRGFDKSVTVSGVSSLLDAATELVPSLTSFQIVELWSGLRPDTADHLPILGPSSVESLYLATGHFRNGILLAPVSAEIVSQCIVRKQPLPDYARAFGVERFFN